MPTHVPLNNVDHKDLKVISDYSEKYGDNVNAVVTFPTEYADVQREYPIFFRKSNDEAGYQSVALLGLKPNENLFLDEKGWNASYVPDLLSKGPFLIGFQEEQIDGEPQKEMVIHIDMDDPRVNTSEGHDVFLKHGGNSPYLERIADTLTRIHRGLSYSKEMFAAFERYELLEPVNIDIEVHNDEKVNLKGFYTINEDKLHRLDGTTLENLNRSGFLQGAFLVIASMTNVKKLIELKRRRILKQQEQNS